MLIGQGIVDSCLKWFKKESEYLQLHQRNPLTSSTQPELLELIFKYLISIAYSGTRPKRREIGRLYCVTLPNKGE